MKTWIFLILEIKDSVHLTNRNSHYRNLIEIVNLERSFIKLDKTRTAFFFCFVLYAFLIFKCEDNSQLSIIFLSHLVRWRDLYSDHLNWKI